MGLLTSVPDLLPCCSAVVHKLTIAAAHFIHDTLLQEQQQQESHKILQDGTRFHTILAQQAGKRLCGAPVSVPHCPGASQHTVWEPLVLWLGQKRHARPGSGRLQGLQLSWMLLPGRSWPSPSSPRGKFLATLFAVSYGPSEWLRLWQPVPCADELQHLLYHVDRSGL